MKLQNLIHILIGIVCLGLFPNAQAVVPAPDGGYPGGNTAEGQSALFSLTTGGYNTAVGFFSLRSNTIGSFNTALGAGTLFASTGDQNTATGAGALLGNTTGNENTANGVFALASNITGSFNTADGGSALARNTTGSSNTAIGEATLYNNTTGISNIALGVGAGSGVTTASAVIAIGANGADVSGSCYIGHIYGQPVDPAAYGTLVIDTSGKLGTMLSSRRFKKDIKPLDSASDAILSLKPVTFHYTSDVKNTPCFGLIAEEVAQVNPDLVVRDEDGRPLSVRYDAVNAMLLNEFLKEHKKVEEQGGTINQLKKDFRATVAALTARLKEQDSKIEKVSVRLAAASPSRGGLEMSKFATGRIRRGGPAPQIVLNNQ
jgi:hypothetical protein